MFARGAKPAYPVSQKNKSGKVAEESLMNVLRTKVSIILMAVLVAGCSTLDGVLDREAEIVLHTKLSPEKVESCVIRHFSDRPTQLSKLRHPTADGWVITSYIGSIDFIIEGIRSGEGTRIIYKRASFMNRAGNTPSPAKAEKKIRRCVR